MADRYRHLARTQLDEELDAARRAATTIPADGWIRTIREALGMSVTDLAQRLGVTQQTASQYERAEQAGTMKLETLRTIAEALGADLRYTLAPRVPLTQQVLDRATEVARRELDRVNHSMALEDQLPAGGDADELAARVAELVDSRRLWVDE
jgi:predicted DNA-binding mobile mystery protein A